MKAISIVLGLAALFLTACATSGSAATEEAPAPAQKVNLALGKSISSNGHIYDFVAPSAVDGEVLSYFEGPANNYPNLVTLDLGQVTSVHSLVLKLNPKRIWQARTQTLEVLASDDGKTFTTVVPSAAYDFDPEENKNTVTIPWAGSAQFLQLKITANTEATAGQLAEWEVY